MTKTFNLGLILLALLLLHSVHVQTRQAEPPQGAATPQAQPVEDSLGRRTPHGTVVGLITAVEQANLDRAAEYLESGLSPLGRRELAQKLGIVLDRKLLTSLDSLSDEPDGDAGDGLTDRDRIGLVESPSGNVEIFLDRVQRGQGAPIWLFSSSTLQEIPRLYDELEPPWIERYVPEPLRTTRWLSLPLYRWIGFLLFIPLIFGLAMLSTRALTVLLRSVVPPPRANHDYRSRADAVGTSAPAGSRLALLRGFVRRPQPRHSALLDSCGRDPDESWPCAGSRYAWWMFWQS